MENESPAIRRRNLPRSHPGLDAVLDQTSAEVFSVFLEALNFDKLAEWVYQ